MKLIPSPRCELCQNQDTGTFMHMYWHCPKVEIFGKMVTSTLSTFLSVEIPQCPKLLLLNDTSSLAISKCHISVLFSGLTAAKKMLALHWKPPHSLSRSQWLNSLLDIVYMELSVARMHNAKHATIISWSSAVDKIKNILCSQTEL